MLPSRSSKPPLPSRAGSGGAAVPVSPPQGDAGLPRYIVAPDTRLEASSWFLRVGDKGPPGPGSSRDWALIWPGAAHLSTAPCPQGADRNQVEKLLTEHGQFVVRQKDSKANYVRSRGVWCSYPTLLLVLTACSSSSGTLSETRWPLPALQDLLSRPKWVFAGGRSADLLPLDRSPG